MNQEHHAQICKFSYRWVQTYTSTPEGETLPEAFEFRCAEHQIGFWLAIPSPNTRDSDSMSIRQASREEDATARNTQPD